MIYEDDFNNYEETIKSNKIVNHSQSQKNEYGVDPYWGENYTRDYNSGKLYDYFGHEVKESKNDYR